MIGSADEIFIDTENAIEQKNPETINCFSEKSIHDPENLDYDEHIDGIPIENTVALRETSTKIDRNILRDPENTKTENTKTENTKTKNTKTENTKTKNTKTENTKTGNTKTENTKTENTKTENTKTKNTKTGNTKTENTKTENTKTDEIENEPEKEILSMKRKNKEKKELENKKRIKNSQIEAANNRLLRQVDRELARLTTPETHHALNSIIQERIENTDTRAEPLTYREALNSPQRNEWVQGIREELWSLYINRTWGIVKGDEPQANRAIGSKWVFKVKTNPDKSIRYKAQLVVKGYHQIKGIDYNETYAPVSRSVSLRVLLAFAAKNHWRCGHMDVVTAFLHPEIDQTDIFVGLPELYDLGDLSEFNLPSNTNLNQRVRLKKALYGLKQSPRLWNKEIDSFLKYKPLGFKQSTAEPNLYLTTDAIILLYVDDLQIFYKLQDKAEETIKRKI